MSSSSLDLARPMMFSINSRSIKQSWTLKTFTQWDGLQRWTWFYLFWSHSKCAERNQSQISDMLSEKPFWRKWKSKFQRVRPSWSRSHSLCLVTESMPILISFFLWCTCSLWSPSHAPLFTLYMAKMMPKAWNSCLKEPQLLNNFSESTLLATWEEPLSCVKRVESQPLELLWTWHVLIQSMLKSELLIQIIIMMDLCSIMESFQIIHPLITNALQKKLV